MTDADREKAKKLLSEGRRIKREMRRTNERAVRIYASLTLGAAPCGERVRGSKRNVEEEKRIQYAELLSTLKTLENDLYAASLNTERKIYTVQDLRLRELLTAYYVKCKNFEQIAKDFKMSYRHVLRLHKNAIDEFSKAQKNRGLPLCF